MRKTFIVILPLILGLGGLSLFVAGFVSAVPSGFYPNTFAVAAPGETTINVPKSGTYTLWNETKTEVDGKTVTFPDQAPSGLTIEIRKKADRIAIPMHPSNVGSAEFSIEGKVESRSVALGEWNFESPGEYQIQIGGFTEKRSFELQEAPDVSGIKKGMLVARTGVFLIGAAVLSIIYGCIWLRRPKGLSAK
jgi:hypothetical protein